MRWSVEQRLEFIEFRLFWEGKVNRSDLVTFFNISVPQASADLTRYQEVAQGNILYDKTAKSYIASPDFQPLFLKPSADRFLAQLRSVAAGVLSKDDTWFDRPPAFAVVPLLRRRIDPESLRNVLKAIRTHTAIKIEYQSFTSPNPKWRWIAPHAIGFDGFRWHARAWCSSHADFRDFVLARIRSCGQSRMSDIDASRDVEWYTDVTLRLAPNPELDKGMIRAIELEYAMEHGFTEIKTQVAMSFYVERLLNLDLDPNLLPPRRQQLVLVNRDEVEEIRKNSRLSSCQRDS
jgi:hypothetical protein